jgi:hypothetical protein
MSVSFAWRSSYAAAYLVELTLRSRTQRHTKVAKSIGRLYSRGERFARRAVLQRAMGMLLVVVLESDGQTACSSHSVWLLHERDVIALPSFTKLSAILLS